MSSVSSEDCPKCHTTNWFDNGDTSDLTQVDIEALKCWKCGHRFWLDGAEEIRTTLLQSLDFDGPHDIYIVDGTKSPNDAIYGNEDEK